MLFFSILSYNSIAYSIVYDDSYTYSTGTSSDGFAWGGSDLRVRADGLPYYNKKVICFDWCEDGFLDYCFAEDQSDFDACEARSPNLKSKCDNGRCVITNDIGEWHNIDTASSGDKWTCTVRARFYDNCEDSDYSWGDESSPYYVVSPKKFDCDDTDYYDLEGNYEDNNWKDIKRDISCLPYQACDENHDDQYVYDPEGDIPNPCRTLDGYQCSVGDECISDNCVGSNKVYYRSHCISSSSFARIV